MYQIIPQKNGLENVRGFYCGATNVGMRTNPANSGVSDIDGDVAFIRSDTLCDISAVFTQNIFQASPIKHFQKYPKIFKLIFCL